MAVLQITDIDDRLYEKLELAAKTQRRSIKQEVIMIIESYVNHAKTINMTASEATHEFLQLSWSGDESAEAMINDLRSDRKNSKRFDIHNALFD